MPAEPQRDEETPCGFGVPHHRATGVHRVGVVLRLRGRQMRERLSGGPQRYPQVHGVRPVCLRPRQLCSGIPHAGAAVRGAVGHQRVRAVHGGAGQRGGAGPLVQQPGARDLLRHLVHEPQPRRGVDLHSDLAGRLLVRLAVGVRGRRAVRLFRRGAGLGSLSGQPAKPGLAVDRRLVRGDPFAGRGEGARVGGGRVRRRF